MRMRRREKMPIDLDEMIRRTLETAFCRKPPVKEEAQFGRTSKPSLLLLADIEQIEKNTEKKRPKKGERKKRGASPSPSSKPDPER
ncbi:MAG: hypothetical protein K9L59_02265 [Desulfobacterales bacterium]|nr:hypothetical protein [Desulfobacterales bacterium]